MPSWTTMNDLSTGSLVTEADMDAIRENIEYLLDPNKQQVQRNNSGSYSTTSTVFVDVDATNVKSTVTTNGGPVLVMVTLNASHAGLVNISFDIDVDGTRWGASFTDGICEVYGNSVLRVVNFAILVTGLGAASHTFKLQWKTDAGTAYLVSNSTQVPVTITAVEI